MPKEPEENGFTVVDRRGRRDAPEHAAGSPAAGASQPPPGPSASAHEMPGAPARELDLTVLFIMLASSALVHLGKAPDPMTGAPQRDLTQARLSIDLLRLLREKTEGHRTAEESQLLEDLLYDLHLQFVDALGEATRRPGSSR